MNFIQLIDLPNHRNGGIIDHFFLYRPNEMGDVIINWEIIATFYSDHFGISIIINKGQNAFREMCSTVPDELLDDTQDTLDTSKNPTTTIPVKRQGYERKANSDNSNVTTKKNNKTFDSSSSTSPKLFR